MQYALFDGFERKFLLDALEFGVLKDWKENPEKNFLILMNLLTPSMSVMVDIY